MTTHALLAETLKDYDATRLQRTGEALARVALYLEERRIPYSLAYGTLLGAVRHGGFIPHDFDVDVHIAQRYVHHVKEMARALGVDIHPYSVAPWGSWSEHQKLQVPNGLDIDFLTEHHHDSQRHWDAVEAFFVPESPALARVTFCNRSFSCLDDYEGYLDAVYGKDCLDFVDVQFRQDSLYQGIPRSEKMPIEEYKRHCAGFVQPDLLHVQ